MYIIIACLIFTCNLGRPDTIDNCPLISNPSQADTDVDNIGDPCDNCINVANNGQDDLDQNGYGDSCDPSQNKDRYNSLTPSIVKCTVK